MLGAKITWAASRSSFYYILIYEERFVQVFEINNISRNRESFILRRFPDSLDPILEVCGMILNNFKKKFIKKYLFFVKIDLCQGVFFKYLLICTDLH